MTQPCRETGCGRPKDAPSHRCAWHRLLTLPIEEQIRAADARLAQNRSHATFVERKRVPEHEWPRGERWDAGCQSFVPLFYCTGSRCRACASRAAHKGHVERTYDISHEEYERLLQWQGGRCYVCGQKPRKRRLAVDHDHETNAVRGLLCANDEWGCNVSLRRILDDLGAARRVLEYVEVTPLERMRRGLPPPAFDRVAVKRTGRVGIASLIRQMDSNPLEPSPQRPQERPAASEWTNDPAWAF